MSRHFTEEETTCKCGCGFNEPDLVLMSKLDSLRDVMGGPVYLSSCCRCEEHNRNEGGSSTSSHLDGLAADIICTDNTKRHKMLRWCAHLFDRVGVRADFIHVDVDKTKPRPRLWLY